MSPVPEYVLSYFTSAEVVNIQPLSARNNSIYLIELEEFRYVLKYYPADTAISAIPVNEEASHFLFANGFEALARPILAVDESTQYEMEDGGTWTAHEYIESDEELDWRECTWTPHHCFEAGSLLAEMHVRAIYVEHDLELMGVNSSVLVRSKITEELLLHKTERALEILSARSSHFESSELESRMIWAISNCFAQLGSEAVETSGFATYENWMLAETVMNHGDFHPGNVLFKNKEAQAFIDFDYANFNTPAIELGYGLFMFALRSKLSKDYSFDKDVFRNNFWEECARGFLDGYFLKLKKLENIREYKFDNAMVILRPRMKIAAMYTLFWASEMLLKSEAEMVAGKEETAGGCSGGSTTGFDELSQIACFCLCFLFND